MIEEELYAHLKASVSLVGERIYANIFPQDTEKPAMTYAVDKELSLTCMAGGVGDVEIDWELALYSSEYFENKQVKDEVITALMDFGHGITSVENTDKFDTNEELFVQVIHFTTKD